MLPRADHTFLHEIRGLTELCMRGYKFALCLAITVGRQRLSGNEHLPEDPAVRR